MANYRLTLISREPVAPRLETLRTELITRGFQMLAEQNLNPAFETGQDASEADAYAITFSAGLEECECKTLSQHLGTTFNLDAIIQGTTYVDKPRKLICFDMDSTLIQHEVMDELAYRHGIGEQIAAITESAMRGEISFRESFDRRLACLAGFEASLIPGIAATLKLSPGAKTLVRTLKAHGTDVAILSGGFQNFAVHLQNELGPIDAIHANVLEIEDGKLTGKISNELVNETRKLRLIRELAEERGLESSQTIAVGDGANDIPMLLYAGLGVAYRAKPVVQEKVSHCINHTDLSAILYVLGYTRDQFVE